MVRLGIAGIGIIAKNYIELIAAGRVPEVALTALCSRSEKNMCEVNEQYGLDATLFTDYGRMLHAGVVDAVIICTPHGQHPAMAKQALEAGLHVLVEKPVGIYADEAEDVIEQLKRSPKLVCGVLYNRRASQAYKYVRARIASGMLGELVRCTWLITNLYRTNAYYGSGSWRGTWQGEGGGLLMTQASHQLDLLLWLCGMPVSVRAQCTTVGRPIEVENQAELFLTYANGASGQFIASAHESPGSNLLELCGTKGKITVRDDSTVEMVQLETDERDFAATCPSSFEHVPRTTTESLVFDDSDNPVQQAATIYNFIKAIQGTEAIQCSMEEGLRSLQLIHGAYLSQWLGHNIKLPPPMDVFRKELKRKIDAK